MINRIGKWFDYLYYLLNSTNRHGVHSPFVYEFVDQVLYKNFVNKTEYLEYQRTLMIQSRTTGFDELSLSEYVTKNVLSSKYCELLQRIVLFYGIKQIHEFGPSTGIEFNYLRYLELSGMVPGLKLSSSNMSEPFYSLFKKSQEEFNRAFNQSESELLESEIDHGSLGKSLYLFHRMDLVKGFWETLDRVLIRAEDQDFFIFTHLYANENSMLNWQRVINDPQFHVTIDCFHLGVALKRTQQVKEHFQLRY